MMSEVFIELLEAVKERNGKFNQILMKKVSSEFFSLVRQTLYSVSFGATVRRHRATLDGTWIWRRPHRPVALDTLLISFPVDRSDGG